VLGEFGYHSKRSKRRAEQRSAFRLDLWIGARGSWSGRVARPASAAKVSLAFVSLLRFIFHIRYPLVYLI
jgi:hypothetical protein